MRNVGSVLGNLAVEGMPGMFERGSRRRRRAAAAVRPTVRRVSPMRSSFSSVGRERVLVVRREGPRRRVLRSQRPGGDAAAIGQRRHRHEPAAEVGEAAEQLVAVRSERVIEPRVPLVLVVDLARRPAVVVGRPGRGRQRDTAAAAPAPPDPCGRAESCCPETGCDSSRRSSPDRR